MINRGDVWRVRLPFTGGHTQAGERPAVVVQGDSFTAALPTVFVVPFTSSTGSLRFGGGVLIQPDGQNGLSRPSVALVFQMFPLDQRFCLHRLGTFDSQTLDKILDQLDRLTGR